MNHNDVLTCAALSKKYYEMGVSHMEAGRPAEAMLYLKRADTIYSSDDDVYDAVGEELMDDCSERIGTLEDEPIFSNEFPAAVEEMAEELEEDQIRVWGLLTLSRLVRLGKRLAALPECEIFGELEWAVNLILRSFQEGASGEELNRLSELGGQFYEFSGKLVYLAGGTVSVPGGPDFELFDLDLMMVPETIMSYFFSHEERITGEEGEVPSDPSEIIPCALMIDYCLRTSGTVEDHPIIQREIARIQSDLDFLRSGPTWAAVNQRVKEYMELDILAQ